MFHFSALTRWFRASGSSTLFPRADRRVRFAAQAVAQALESRTLLSAYSAAVLADHPGGFLSLE